MTPLPISQPEPGRSAAFATYVLYLLSIPSAGILALIGVVVAHLAVNEATGTARWHLEEAIRIWWIAFSWAVGMGVLALIGLVLSVVLIGIPIIWLAAFVLFLVCVWFTLKSGLGLLALADGRGR
jgi:uncharacterized membrane protein